MKTSHRNLRSNKTWLGQIKRGLAGISFSACAVIGSQAYAGETPALTWYLSADPTTSITELCNSTLRNVNNDDQSINKTRQEWLALTELPFSVSLSATETRDFLWDECTYTLVVTGDTDTTDFTTNFPDLVITAAGNYPGTVTRNFTGAQSSETMEYKLQVSIRAEPVVVPSP